MLYYCRLPAKEMDVEFEDPRLSDDVFGMVVRNLDDETAADIQSKLDGYGAIETSITGGDNA